MVVEGTSHKRRLRRIATAPSLRIEVADLLCNEAGPRRPPVGVGHIALTKLQLHVRGLAGEPDETRRRESHRQNTGSRRIEIRRPRCCPPGPRPRALELQHSIPSTCQFIALCWRQRLLFLNHATRFQGICNNSDARRQSARLLWKSGCDRDASVCCPLSGRGIFPKGVTRRSLPDVLGGERMLLVTGQG